MKSGIDLDETIERYLGGKMTEEEKAVFEDMISSDYLLKEKVEEHLQLISSIAVYGRRNKVKGILNKIHNEIIADIKAEMPKEPVIRRMHNPYKTLAIAASVALLILSGSLSVIYLSYFQSHGKAEFRELRRDVERIRKSQKDIINDLSSNMPVKEIIPADFMGTGFAISSNGYLITSRHVIKDADSVYIENALGRYKSKVVFIDNYLDYAILKITDSSFKSFGNIPFAIKKSDLDLGEKIYTLGYPGEEIVFGEGSLSSQSGYLGDSSSYQVSIPVNPGNSGGPVLDERGNLIGMISGKQSSNEGAGFAIKSSILYQSLSNIPVDSIFRSLKLPKNSLMVNYDRPKQIKKLKNFIFIVKVYN